MHRYDELENRWKKYNMKRNLRLYSLPFGVVILGFVAYYFVFVALNEKEVRVAKTEQYTAAATSSSTQSSPVIAHSSSSQYSQSSVHSPLLAQNEQNITDQSLAKEEAEENRSVAATSQIKIIKDCYFVNTPILNIREKPNTDSLVLGKLKHGDTVCPSEVIADWIKIDSGWVFSRSLIPLDTKSEALPKEQTKEAPIAQQQEKPSMLVEYRSIDIPKRIEALKERFAVSKDYRVALELSEIYYDKKEYVQAQNWALSANEIEKNSETSWILFAKSSYKLGDKEAAKKALKTYLLKSDSASVRNLLQEIEKESFE